MAPSYASGVGSQPLIGETIGALLERVAAEHPDHEALVSRHQGIRLTYAELDAEADRLARGFMAAGPSTIRTRLASRSMATARPTDLLEQDRPARPRTRGTR